MTTSSWLIAPAPSANREFLQRRGAHVDVEFAREFAVWHHRHCHRLYRIRPHLQYLRLCHCDQLRKLSRSHQFDAFLITTDGGATWTNLDPNQTLPSRSVTSLAFDPTTPGTLYATFARVNAASPNQSGHLFKTTNALAATPVWVDISPPVDTPNNVIAVDPANPSSLYVGTDAAVWRSPNGGSGWQFLGLSTGLPNVPVFDLEINPSACGSIARFHLCRGVRILNQACHASVRPTGHTLRNTPASDASDSVHAESRSGRKSPVHLVDCRGRAATGLGTVCFRRNPRNASQRRRFQLHHIGPGQFRRDGVSSRNSVRRDNGRRARLDQYRPVA